jgi:endonuclease/exonuclease/phosphatase (EEP) superfamily protein YafD
MSAARRRGFREPPSGLPARLARGLLAPVAALVHVGLLGVAAATFAPLLAGWVPAFAALESFRILLAGAGGVLAVAGLLFRPRWLMLLGVVGCLWNLWIVWPYLPSAGHRPAPAAGAMPRFKAISINLWYRNDSYAAAVNYLLDADADVVGLVELTPQWLSALKPVFERYPYRIDCMASRPPCEIMLLSKQPFAGSFAGRIDGRSPTIAWGEVSFAGRPVVVMETHLAWPLLPAVDNRQRTLAGSLQAEPLTGAAPLLQSQQASALAQYLRGLGPDLVLMGDFNGVPWSRTQAALRAATGLRDRGPAVPTWPAWSPDWLRLPIDHILVRGALRRLTFRRGFFVGSDHLPVEAEIALEPR